tara:strand:+ start:164 stop:370 length:207 start_codon:yes stop_codon:yes gene_type:complete
MDSQTAVKELVDVGYVMTVVDGVKMLGIKDQEEYLVLVDGEHLDVLVDATVVILVEWVLFAFLGSNIL